MSDIELKQLSRQDTKITSPSAEMHLLGVQAGSIQRIADAVERGQADKASIEAIELKLDQLNRRIDALGELVDLRARDRFDLAKSMQALSDRLHDCLSRLELLSVMHGLSDDLGDAEGGDGSEAAQGRVRAMETGVGSFPGGSGG